MANLDEPSDEFEIIEELTAYLDGELDETQIQKVEQRLGEDASYLEQMRSLQQTWDALDQLQPTEPGVSFTKTTMELVLQDVAKSSRPISWVWPLRIGIMLAVILVGFGVSFGFLRYQQGRPDRMLVEHVTTIDNYERYEAVDLDLDFLQGLLERNLFPPSEIDLAEGSKIELEPTSDEVIREAWLQDLDIERKRDLQRKLDGFMELDRRRQEALIDFEQRLFSAPERDDLIFVLNEYVTWLKTFDNLEKVSLMDKPAEERLKEVARLRSEQAERQLMASNQLPTSGDAEPVYQWFDSLIRSNESEIRRHFPDAVGEFRDELGLAPMPPSLLGRLARRGPLSQVVDYLMDVDPEFIQQKVNDELELNLLYNMLSPQAKTVFMNQTDESRIELVMNWVKAANEASFRVNRDRLRKFAASLPDSERAELDQLPSDAYVKRLKEKYRRDSMPSLQSNDPAIWRRLMEMSSSRR